jgi:hypothetical protein
VSGEQRVSEHGAKIAAGKIGCTVAEYRQHEAAGEHWCPRCESWRPVNGTQGYCRPCREQYQHARFLVTRGGGGVTLVGPSHSVRRS